MDFERIFLIARTRAGLSQFEIERATFGRWADIFWAFKELYNFETKQCLYADVEQELKQREMENQPVASLLSL